MAGKKKTAIVTDSSTEERILQAARTIFLRKGYAAARTRDIAEEAGLNIALLHYYFRSKEKLFEQVMLETLQQFAAGMIDMLNSTKTSLQGKLTILADRYIDLLIQQPELPMFIIAEAGNNPDNLISKLGIREALMQSVFLQQFNAMARQSKTKAEPIQLFLSILGMTIFPFAAKPIVQAVFGASNDAFRKMMEDRRKLIPTWIETMLESW